MAEKKITKRDKFAMLLPLVADNPMLTEFIEHEMELLSNKKSSSKPTANQVLNAQIADVVMDILLDEGKQTVGALIKHSAVRALLPDITSQRMTQIVTAMKDAGKVKRVVEKKIAYFEANEDGE